MAKQSVPQATFEFEDLKQQVVARFDQEHSSSDGGVVLLKSADQSLGLTAGIAARLHDPRAPSKTTHSMHELVEQRVFGVGAAYEDANDAARLAEDPVFKLALGRDPIDGAALASQPTISRLENGFTKLGEGDVRKSDLYRIGDFLMKRVIRRHRSRLGKTVKRITIDMDPTDDLCHGAQQLSMFNTHYGGFCYLPMLGTLQFGDEQRQYLFGAVLRPGNVKAHYGAVGILRRVIKCLRKAFPKARLRVRLDGGFASPKLFDFLDGAGVEYLVAMAKNSVLKRRSEDLMEMARELSEITGESERYYGKTKYKAGSWKSERRVIFKAEVVRFPGRKPRDNQRFIVTNLRHKPENVYNIYRQRGDPENRGKELLLGLKMDRTSCTSFWANQLRLFWAAAAYILWQEVQLQAEGTGCAKAQVWILQLRLIKMACWVRRSVRRIVLHLPANAPWKDDWLTIAARLASNPG